MDSVLQHSAQLKVCTLSARAAMQKHFDWALRVDSGGAVVPKAAKSIVETPGIT